MTALLRRAAAVVLAVAALAHTGCFTIAKQAFHEARGAQGDVLLISGSAASLSPYQRVDFAPATTTVGPRVCPPELLRAYDRALQALQPRLQPSYPGGTPALVVTSETLYFQGKGLLGGAFMLTRVKLQSDEQLVVDALVRAESDAFRAGGEGDLARASAEALFRFLDRTRPSQRPERARS